MKQGKRKARSAPRKTRRLAAHRSKARPQPKRPVRRRPANWSETFDIPPILLEGDYPPVASALPIEPFEPPPLVATAADGLDELARPPSVAETPLPDTEPTPAAPASVTISIPVDAPAATEPATTIEGRAAEIEIEPPPPAAEASRREPEPASAQEPIPSAPATEAEGAVEPEAEREPPPIDAPLKAGEPAVAQGLYRHLELPLEMPLSEAAGRMKAGLPSDLGAAPDVEARAQSMPSATGAIPDGASQGWAPGASSGEEPAAGPAQGQERPGAWAALEIEAVPPGSQPPAQPVQQGIHAGEPIDRAPGAGRPFWFNVNAELIVYGATDPAAKVALDQEAIALRSDGTFTLRFALPDGDYALELAATSPTGGETRHARLAFRRRTGYRGEVGVHPAQTPVPPPADRSS
ncbi:MAG: hypothetical protein KA118_06620 [Verrucomicrobia bacterium]|nr:hypothetical protein [Verrucomicrobiota bacterium]